MGGRVTDACTWHGNNAPDDVMFYLVCAGTLTAFSLHVSKTSSTYLDPELARLFRVGLLFSGTGTEGISAAVPVPDRSVAR